MYRKHIAALLVTVVLAGGACGRGDDLPARAPRSAAAEQPNRGLPTPSPGYYLMVNVNLASAEIDTISIQVFGTVQPLAGLQEGETPPGWSRFHTELDNARFAKARTYVDLSRAAGFSSALVAEDPGGPSGCGPMACITGSPAEGYVVVLDGPYDGPPPADVNDPAPAQIALTQAQADFQKAKTTEVFGPDVVGRSPELASLTPLVSWLAFS
jgi:hypothetical protein